MPRRAKVGPLTRERAARELDDRGPERCRLEIMGELEASNPEILDMAMRCARDVGELSRVMTGFCVFYRVLRAEAYAAAGVSVPAGDRYSLSLLPRVTPATREIIARRIDSIGSGQFTRNVIAELERNNPELLVLSHNFAENQADYLGVMQGFTLLYACLLEQASRERGSLH